MKYALLALIYLLSRSLAFLMTRPNFNLGSQQITRLMHPKAALVEPVFTDVSLVERMAQPVDPGPYTLYIKDMALNIWGVLYGLSIFITATLIFPFIIIITIMSDLFGNKSQRRVLDWAIHLWANTAMGFLLTRVELIGAENLPKHNETVVYVPNHTSFMDIMIMSGFIPRPFKYLSKAEIFNIPIIGQAMLMAKHVFIKRDSVESIFKVTEETVQHLIDGNSMVVFAEGSRSRDGKLKAFKKGAFQMAKRAGAKIIPVSIGNIHRFMPSSAILPLAPIRHVYVKIHNPIEMDENTKVSVVRKQCFTAVNSGLPSFQQFVHVDED
jgi:1-acyl-sn-glycerol-3-phosphate acyltransferase